LIEVQNRTLNTAFQQIEKQNIDIKSSINYAKRIQTAMLLPVEEIQKYFPDTFIFLRPKDVVSGDFYYFTALDNDQYIVAAVDCTGHGVPGAFMSLIGNTLLDEIVHILNYTQPNEILKELDQRVRRLLKQQESTQKDGMDLTVCHIDKQREELQCAGAMNPLLIVKDNEVEYIKGDRHAIGGFLDIHNAKQFDNHQITIKDYQSVIVYMFSDGFQDQFGGKPLKKFMQKNFKELLVKNSVLPFVEQRQVLNSTLENWIAAGNETQIDDVLVMGIKIK
jgi:sigma-B regulation protein RsbU (phosphoserine phosphatase)